jgi:monoamine oxidase
VVEARDRVGGRARSVGAADGRVLELGGEFVGRGQSAVVRLADEFGVDLVDLPVVPGRRVRIFGGERLEEDELLGADPRARAGLSTAIAALEQLATGFPVGSPWLAPEAADLDSQTLRGWMEAHIPEPAVRTILNIELAFGQMGSLSFLHALSTLRSVGGFEALWGEVSAVFDGGPGALCRRIAAELGPEGLLTSSPVRRIVASAGSATVESDTLTAEASAVIVALSPTLAAQIAFEPPLPPRRRLLQQRWAQNPGLKFIATYQRPWWRDKGLSGTATGDETVAVPIVFDSSPADASLGVLVGFTNSTRVPSDEMLAGEESRRTALGRSLAGYFGPAAGDFIDYHEGVWAEDPWAAGCNSYPAPGVLTAFGPQLREPVGGIIWAGTETSPEWHGYFEGAIRSGERAAEEARRLLEG